ncbi:TolC family protein [Schlesneria paludicola]|uniref:TolC family protein n=1 Tax=Schlesneria paludicola TaxID=360056 RepID=UPI00029B177B|nr:TolC family protein [Schlesneria paludicola]
MASYTKTLCLLMVVCCGCRAAENRHSISHRPRQKATSNNVVARSDGETTDRNLVADNTIANDVEADSGRTILTVSGEEPARDDDAKTPVPPTSSLSLASSIALGLSQNPDLTALRQAEHVSVAALGVAETYPFNPSVQVQATPYQDNARTETPGTTYHYILLMQTIQLAHQQQFREQGAVSTLNSTRWNIHQAELQNVAQTERLYFTTLYLSGLLELAKANDDNNQQLLQTLEKQLEAGQATAADAAIVRVDARSTHHQLRLAKVNYETALRDFKRQIGIDPDDPSSVVGDLRVMSWRTPSLIFFEPQAIKADLVPEREQQREKFMIASKAAARPDVMAALSDIEVARANLCLATASRTPDLQIGPYYQRTADGTTFLGFRAQVDLMIVNSGKPLERQRAAELNQRAMMWQQTARRAELEAAAAWERYKLAYDAVAEEAQSGIGELPNELQRLEQQFLAGEVDLVRVVQARASIIQNQRARLDLMNELSQSAANLTGVTGIPVEELLE